MANIRDVTSIAAKWASVTPMRSADYKAGVENPKTDWKTATAAAGENWKNGVTKAAAENRFSKAVAKASLATWQVPTLAKGVNRWGEGVALAQPKYEAAFAPFVSAIKALTLPPRYPRRDPRNLDRVKAVVDAMIKTAQALTG